MGGGSSKNDASKLEIEDKAWEELEKRDFHEVVRNRSNGTEGNRYHFNIKSNRPLKEEVDIYLKRQGLNNWVQIIGAKVKKGGFGFCGSQDSATVITERIPLTLNQVSRLNRQESNVAVYNALRGFNDVSKLVVPSNINSQMIGFTPVGQTKVWVNENFGMNYPKHYDKDSMLIESEMVRNLIDAVQPHVDLSPDFINALRNSGGVNNALNFIKTNSGISLNQLESGKIDISRHLGRQQTPAVIKDHSAFIQKDIFNDRPFVAQQPVQQNYYRPPSSSVYFNQAPVVNNAYHPDPNVHFAPTTINRSYMGHRS